jgi:hypothetical protein
MPCVSRRNGLFQTVAQGQPKPMTLNDFQKAVSPDWFTSQAAFEAKVLYAAIEFPQNLVDSTFIRALVIFMHFGWVQTVKECPVCKGGVRVEHRVQHGTPTLTWTCCASGHKHLDQNVNVYGVLREINLSNWMPFLVMLVLLWNETRWKNIIQEIQTLFGNIKKQTFQTWRVRIHRLLKLYLDQTDAWKIGGSKEVVVLDESVIGFHPLKPKGISKSASSRRTGVRSKDAVRKRILKQLPARTVWKKPAAILKRPAAASPSTFSSSSASSSSVPLHKRPAAHVVLKRPSAAVHKKPASACMSSSTSTSSSAYSTSGPMRKRPAAHVVLKRPSAKVHKNPASSSRVQGTHRDTRSNGRWMWAAVTVGSGKERYTHENGLKQFTYKFLPASHDAKDGKPRGLQEIKDVLQQRVKPGSFLVFDKWRSTVSATKQLGYACAPPVNHAAGWRDPITGYHSNDIESENHRVKNFLRKRYGRLQLDPEALDLVEYMFKVNRGRTFAVFMSALAQAQGGAYLAVVL